MGKFCIGMVMFINLNHIQYPLIILIFLQFEHMGRIPWGFKYLLNVVRVALDSEHQNLKVASRTSTQSGLVGDFIPKCRFVISM
jgi:hypothetical protein